MPRWDRLLPLALGAWVLFILAQVLRAIPELSPTPSQGQALVWGLEWLPSRISLTDIAVNLAAFAVLGLLWGLLAITRGWHRRRLWSGLALGFGLSALAELLQRCIPGRSASMLDLGMDTLGTCLGILLALTYHRTVLSAIGALIEPPSGLGLPIFLYLVCLSLYRLWPLQLRTAPNELWHALVRMRLNPLELPTGGLTELLLDSSDELGAFLVLGLLLARRWGPHRLARSLMQGWGLALMLEVLQLFMVHHGVDMRQVLASGVGASVGIGLGRLVRPAWASASALDSAQASDRIT